MSRLLRRNWRAVYRHPAPYALVLGLSGTVTLLAWRPGPAAPAPPTPLRAGAAAPTPPAPSSVSPPAVPPTTTRAARPATLIAGSTPPPSVPAAPGAGRVGLQVGHGNMAALPDSLAVLRDQTGAVAAGRREVDLNLDFARRTAALLASAGVGVDLLPGAIPNGYQADAFVAIHADANFARPVRGYNIVPPYRSAVAWADAVLAATLEVAYAPATALPRDPEITDNMRGYYAINGWMGAESRIAANTPGLVVETGFMTSPADRAVLFDQPERVAQGLARGILAYLQQAATAATVQQAAAVGAATAPTGCSAGVLLDATPLRAAPDPQAPVVAGVDRGTVLPFLDNTARPLGPFTRTAGRRLATQTGYYRVAPPGGGAPVYLNHGPAIVQLPRP